MSDVQVPDYGNPIDVVESIAGANKWASERFDDGEIQFFIIGSEEKYQVVFTQMHALSSLHMCWAFYWELPQNLSPLRELLSLINAQLWIGHFDVFPKEGMIAFRYALLLEDDELSCEEGKEMLTMGLEASERFIPAMRLVLAGTPPQEALAVTYFESIGTA